MDQIETNLIYIAEQLETAWKAARCLTCPLGELAALAAATVVFYQEASKQTGGDPP